MNLFRNRLLLALPRRFAAGIVTCVALAAGSAQTRAQNSSVDESPAQQLFLQGQDLVSQGRLAEAEIPLIQAASLSPRDIDLLVLLGKLRGRLGEHKEAVSTFRRIVQLQPRVADNHLNLAIALADEQQLDAALAETAAALALEPRSASAHLNRARLLADLHRNQEARAEFELASRYDSHNPDIFRYWALLEHDENHLAKETELLQHLVQLQPNNDRDYFYLGRSLSEQSRSAEAVAALRRAISLNPHAGDALYMLSMEVKHSDPAEARRLLQQFIQVRDEDAKLENIKNLGNQAYAASKRQDWPEATQLLRQALSMCGDCSIAAGLHRNLGLALCQSGDLEEGAKELRATLALDPNDRDAAAALNMISR